LVTYAGMAVYFSKTPIEKVERLKEMPIEEWYKVALQLFTTGAKASGPPD